MGFFSFLFGSSAKPINSSNRSEPANTVSAVAEPDETALEMTNRMSSDSETESSDALVDAISVAVEEKSPAVASMDTLSADIDDALLSSAVAAEPEEYTTAEIPIPESDAGISAESTAADVAVPEAQSNATQAEEGNVLEEWGSGLTQDIASESFRKSSIPLFDDETLRLVWKLKGTGKKRRQRVIHECVKDQPVFVICNSNGSNCTVITEEGEEIGCLNEQDSAVYHTLVAGSPHNLYIKKIRISDSGKPKVKVLVIVRERKR